MIIALLRISLPLLVLLKTHYGWHEGMVMNDGEECVRGHIPFLMHKLRTTGQVGSSVNGSQPQLGSGSLNLGKGIYHTESLTASPNPSRRKKWDTKGPQGPHLFPVHRTPHYFMPIDAKCLRQITRCRQIHYGSSIKNHEEYQSDVLQTSEKQRSLRLSL